MHGTFNGVRLRRITSVATESAGDKRLTTFRALEYRLPELEAQLHLDAHALVILSDKTIEGRVIVTTPTGEIGMSLLLNPSDSAR